MEHLTQLLCQNDMEFDGNIEESLLNLKDKVGQADFDKVFELWLSDKERWEISEHNEILQNFIKSGADSHRLFELLEIRFALWEFRGECEKEAVEAE